jgi:hypothetical protein
MEKRGARKGLTRLNWDEREELLLGVCLPVADRVASVLLCTAGTTKSVTKTHACQYSVLPPS